MELHLPSDHDSTAALHRAQQLDHQARRSARWYVRYLIVFALASFVMASLFGVLPGRWGVAVLTPVWVVFVVALSVWSTRQRASVRGMTQMHLTMMLGWTLAWLATVIVGSSYFPATLWWWVLGGAVMAIPPLLTARQVDRRTRS